MSRKEKRKELKKQKRKQVRREAALLSLQEEGEKNEEAVIRQQREEEEALAKERAEHEEQERLWLLREEKAHKDWLRKQEEEAERKRKNEERSRKGEAEEDLEEGWEYVEDGPAEIIWQGNEIIVKKPRKKVRKDTNSAIQAIEEKDRPTSNPLPPQSTAFSSYQVNVQDVADQATNFGTEQDKRNCPFYIKTGVCRFGVRCSRLHPVFNEACTLLIRSMYTGAGLALEHVESLEYTDEEVVQEYEEFYDDVHSEFIQFGELVNFKVCRNGSPHLRGNVYVHYVSQESTLAAYNHMNGRFYAKKQISCEFVGVMKWKLAICGEFMRTHYKTCSHGSACNFMHCFENPRREYQWADLDRSPPRFWQRKMAAFFGHAHISDEDFDEKQEKARTYRESAHNNDRGRHRGDRELLYDDGRRRDRHMRESVRDDDRRRGRDDRERQCYEDEMKDRSRRESKYDDRLRERHSKENSHDSRRREDVSDSTYDVNSARDMSTSRSMYGDDQGYNIDERWPMFDDNRKTDDTEEVYERDQRRDRRHTETTYDDDDDDFNDNRHPGRHSSTSDHVSLHRHSRSHSRSHSHSHRNRSRRSRSPDSHRTRMSRSRDRSTSQRAHSQDGYVTDEEHEDRYSRATRDSEGKKDRASKDGKRHKNSVSRSGDSLHDNQAAKRDDDIRGHRSRHSSRDRWRYSESDQQRTKPLESDDTRSGHSKDLDGTVAGLVSGEDASGSRMNLETQSDLKTGIDVGNPNQETNSTNSNTMTGLSLALSTDDVQKSTTQWQSWRKAKSKKPGLKDNPMRVII